MNEKNPQEPTDIFLSREELLFVLNVLETGFIPGLDADPLGDLTLAEQSLALTFAERALRARGLAQLQADGVVRVHQTLLQAVGACAYSQNAIFVYHWPTGGEAPIRFFGHIRDNEIVAHTRPEDVVHQLSILYSKVGLVERILQVCGCHDVSDSHSFDFTLPDAVFVQARELAESGAVDQATALMTQAQVDPAAAGAFAATLADSPTVSIFQMVKQGAGESVKKQDSTVVKGSRYTWLLQPNDDAAQSMLTVRTTSVSDIQTLLTTWL